MNRPSHAVMALAIAVGMLLLAVSGVAYIVLDILGMAT